MGREKLRGKEFMDEGARERLNSLIGSIGESGIIYFNMDNGDGRH